MMLSKIDDFMPQKSDSGKITGAKQLEMPKGTEKVPFRRKSGDPDSQAGDHAPRVAGIDDHGPRSRAPATMGIFFPFGRFSIFFGSFC